MWSEHGFTFASKNAEEMAVNSRSGQKEPNWVYMSTNVLLNLLNEFGKKDKMRGFAEHLNGFPQQV